MQLKKYLVLALLILISVTIFHRDGFSQTANREYKLKAAFIINFIKFVTWPQEKEVDSLSVQDTDKQESFHIGILGKDEFLDAFEPAKKKEIKGRQLKITKFDKLNQVERCIDSCHVIFISSSEQKNTESIFSKIKDKPVLTIGETEEFINIGGIIGLIEEKRTGKLRFEINLKAAKQATLEIKSDLLDLATYIIK